MSQAVSRRPLNEIQRDSKGWTQIRKSIFQN